MSSNKTKKVSLQGLIDTCTFLTIIAVLMSVFAKLHWSLELATHFIPQYFLWLSIILIVLSSFNIFYIIKAKKNPKPFPSTNKFCTENTRWKWLSIVAIFWVYLLYQILPECWKNSKLELTDSTKTLRLVTYNIHSSNRQHKEVLDFLSQNSSDITLLLEITPEWVNRLKKLSEIYPYSQAFPRHDNFGIMILSKIPFIEICQRDFAKVGVPSIFAKFNYKGQNFTVLGIHPPPPMNYIYAMDRNRMLEAVSICVLSRLEENFLICGDFNCTPFSPYFKELIDSTQMYDSRKGFGLHFTWPQQIFPLRITIDHCLVSKNIVVHNYKAFPESFGSDHYPVEVQFSIKK